MRHRQKLFLTVLLLPLAEAQGVWAQYGVGGGGYRGAWNGRFGVTGGPIVTVNGVLYPIYPGGGRAGLVPSGFINASPVINNLAPGPYRWTPGGPETWGGLPVVAGAPTYATVPWSVPMAAIDATPSAPPAAPRIVTTGPAVKTTEAEPAAPGPRIIRLGPQTTATSEREGPGPHVISTSRGPTPEPPPPSNP